MNHSRHEAGLETLGRHAQAGDREGNWPVSWKILPRSRRNGSGEQKICSSDTLGISWRSREALLIMEPGAIRLGSWWYVRYDHGADYHYFYYYLDDQSIFVPNECHMRS